MLDPLAHGLVGQLHGGQHADLPGELGIKVATGVVSDGGQVNDGIDAFKVDVVNITHIALGYGQVGVGGQKIAKPLGVEHLDFVAACKQFRDKHSALEAAAAGDE